MRPITGFKAYDYRARIPGELNVDVAYRIGRAYAEFLKPKRIVVGRDIRLSSGELCEALTRGLIDSGVDVYDIGLCGTEGVYFATFSEKMDGGVMVTASHNPPDYNGMKFVREQSRPISGDTGLKEIQKIAEADAYSTPAKKGQRFDLDTRKKYIDHLLSYLDRSKLRKLKIVVNAGNGGAGAIVDQLEPHLPFEFVKINHQADGHFPNGVPNPMLEENRASTIEAIREHKADLGVAWDGDYDRCFFFDETGSFIEGYYIVGLLASMFLRREPGTSIVHDPRLTWATQDMVTSLGGKVVMSKSGHAFMKDVMRQADAAYGGEMSAHHYFRAFGYCDSGQIPWLLVAQLMCESGKKLSSLVGERIAAFPASGEINRKVADAKATIQKVEAHYKPGSLSVDYTDGLSIEFGQWRFNLRSSNTEPLIRLNVESRQDVALMQAKTRELLEMIGGEIAH
ncbi:phosphomannomutase/phosphomannomutase/phosphoglucomutase [Povalibacter uvarum]|uniref:phosphomannomutase n=1 Tax=Povalibacter uvarum TaxID=732238 RepID=A0A841HHR4_9GAMM|nr:phosphomannomutase [Povalibacter uvarum]MBB6091615.1 phosphomannomutase/phosphomannomutase/phosphoglucomutase [Povalibacter uvarum]